VLHAVVTRQWHRDRCFVQPIECGAQVRLTGHESGNDHGDAGAEDQTRNECEQVHDAVTSSFVSGATSRRGADLPMLIERIHTSNRPNSTTQIARNTWPMGVAYAAV